MAVAITIVLTFLMFSVSFWSNAQSKSADVLSNYINATGKNCPGGKSVDALRLEECEQHCKNIGAKCLSFFFRASPPSPKDRCILKDFACSTAVLEQAAAEDAYFIKITSEWMSKPTEAIRATTDKSIPGFVGYQTECADHLTAEVHSIVDISASRVQLQHSNWPIDQCHRFCERNRSHCVRFGVKDHVFYSICYIFSKTCTLADDVMTWTDDYVYKTFTRIVEESGYFGKSQEVVVEQAPEFEDFFQPPGKQCPDPLAARVGTREHDTSGAVIHSGIAAVHKCASECKQKEAKCLSFLFEPSKQKCHLRSTVCHPKDLEATATNSSLFYVKRQVANMATMLETAILDKFAGDGAGGLRYVAELWPAFCLRGKLEIFPGGTTAVSGEEVSSVFACKNLCDGEKTKCAMFIYKKPRGDVDDPNCKLFSRMCISNDGKRDAGDCAFQSASTIQETRTVCFKNFEPSDFGVSVPSFQEQPIPQQLLDQVCLHPNSPACREDVEQVEQGISTKPSSTPPPPPPPAQERSGAVRIAGIPAVVLLWLWSSCTLLERII